LCPHFLRFLVVVIFVVLVVVFARHVPATISRVISTAMNSGSYRPKAARCSALGDKVNMRAFEAASSVSFLIAACGVRGRGRVTSVGLGLDCKLDDDNGWSDSLGLTKILAGFGGGCISRLARWLAERA
jgi:hypothetical protein